MRASSVVPLGELPGDRPAGLAASAAAGIGVVSGAALAAMYAVEVPRGGPYRFGAVDDFTGGLFFAATIPVIVQVHRRLGDGPWSRAAETAVITGSVAAAVSGVLLAFHRIPFKPSTAVSIAGIAGQAAWAAVAHHKLLGTPGYPQGLARAGRAIGCGMLAGLPLVAAGFATPKPKALKWALWGVGGTLGAASYLAWPIWFGAWGRHLRRVTPTRQAGPLDPSQPSPPSP